MAETEARVARRTTTSRPPQHPVEEGPVREASRESEHPQARTRRRTRSATVADNPFDIPVSEIPAGSTYEWKRYTVMGKEDPFYISNMRAQGWEPVDPKAHPNWLPPNYKESHIVRDGLILMERPKELTEEARAEQRQLSKQQVREAEQRLGMTPNNTLTREHDRVKPQVTKEMMRPIAIQEE